MSDFVINIKNNDSLLGLAFYCLAIGDHVHLDLILLVGDDAVRLCIISYQEVQWETFLCQNGC